MADLDNRTVAKEATQPDEHARRRALLKAAAAAPFLATIPSGAARATPSTYQCIIDDDNSQPDAAQVGIVSERPVDDRWVRTEIKSWLFRKSANDEITLYHVDGNPTQVGGSWFSKDGSNEYFLQQAPNDDYFVQLNESPSTRYDAVGDAEDQLALVVYVPTGPDGPYTGIRLASYEANKRSVYPRIRLDENTNMALRLSCLGSVDPGDITWLNL